MVKDEDANYSNPNVVDAYLNDFNIDFPVFGYDHIISKKVSVEFSTKNEEQSVIMSFAATLSHEPTESYS